MNALRMVDQSIPDTFLQIAFMRGDEYVGQLFCTVAGNTFRGARNVAGKVEMRKFSTLEAAMCFAVSGTFAVTERIL